MSEWTDEGIILRLGVFHESDMWLKILFRKHGIKTVFAFGATRSKVRFCGCLDLFSTIEGRIKSSRNGQYMNLMETSLLAMPRNLRVNRRNLGLAANCMRFLEANDVDDSSSPFCYALVSDLEEMLETTANPPSLTPQFFRLRMASALGYAPELSNCGQCGSEPLRQGTFVINEGRLYCEKCAKMLGANRYNLNLSKKALSKLQDVQTSLPASWSDTDLDNEEKRRSSRLIDNFVEYHMGLKWDRGFYRHI